MFRGLITLTLIYSLIYCSKQSQQCPVVLKTPADIDTVDNFPKLDFEQVGMGSNVVPMWTENIEKRFEMHKDDNTLPELKVIVVPHSHNDPGWLHTFEEYYEMMTRNILHNIVEKLEQLPNMTFVWNEMSFLEKWWSEAPPDVQNAFKNKIKEGRLEITTGGWVMPDEACTHIYSLLDQYIEGHEWLRTNLGISPKTGWSIDPFGHGPTVPYLLDQSGIKGTIIQRLHSSWKQWFAEQKIEEFYWLTGWSKTNPSLVVHNMPLEIYSVKGSCGPHPLICEEYDFMPSESIPLVKESNIELTVNKLIQEYKRLGSLTSHNVVLVLLGQDFSYENELEFDAKYNNYQIMFDYINSRKDKYNAHVRFGTPSDFFKEIENYAAKNKKAIPTLKGDFFPYADTSSSNKAQYWTGFYTTRPFTKILVRLFEHHLRTAEILYSLVFNMINCKSNPSVLRQYLLDSYKDLVSARRNLGLFQHHDGITGTSKSRVMLNYFSKLDNSFKFCLNLQQRILSNVMINDSIHINSSDANWNSYKKTTLPILENAENKIVVFNSLTEAREVVVKILIDAPDVKVYDNYRKMLVVHQTAPIVEIQKNKQSKDIVVVNTEKYELSFVANLPALSAVTYTLSRSNDPSARSKIYCKHCFSKDKKEWVYGLASGNIQIENSVYKLKMNEGTGLLKNIYNKKTKTNHLINVELGAYNSLKGESGAYLFKPDPRIPERQDFNNPVPDTIILIKGPLFSEFIVINLKISYVNRLKIFHSDNLDISRAISMRTLVYLANHNDTELIVRFNTDLNTDKEFYTDQNGFQYQKRVRVDKLGIEGNYYPITTMAWIQDDKTRLTYITDHAQGVSSFVPGRLEVMLDRRIVHDDGRGLDEGILDKKGLTFHSHLVLENISPASDRNNEYPLPSKYAEYLSRNLNYPVNVYYSKSYKETVSAQPYKSFAELPKHLHLMTLRTITKNDLPSSSSYMVLQRPGYSCQNGYQMANNTKITSKFNFNNINISNIAAVSLTGLHEHSKISSLQQIHLEPMEIKTYRLNFLSDPNCKKQ